MNDIWTTKGYTNKDKADEIAKKYNLDAIMVRKALGEGEVFSDNMLVIMIVATIWIIPLTEYVDFGRV